MSTKEKPKVYCIRSGGIADIGDENALIASAEGCVLVGSCEFAPIGYVCVYRTDDQWFGIARFGTQLARYRNFGRALKFALSCAGKE